MADDIKFVIGVDYSDLTGLVKTSEQTKRVLSSAAKDFARTGNQKQYMHAINKIVQAQKQLDASSRMSRSQIMQLGAEMQREAKFTDELSRATHRLSDAMGASRNKMNGSNMAVQQLGYQVGDFAVQVQGGTSAFVAFSQQGAQLAGMLPMIAGPLGLSMTMAVGLSAAFGILIPIGSAIARMFFEVKDSAKEAAEEAETLDNKLESLDGTLKDYANTLAALKAGFSLDELFATQGVEGAVDALKEAENALNTITSGEQLSGLGGIDITAFLDIFREGTEESRAMGAAVIGVIEARTRLQLLLEKEADTRASNFAESSLAMKQELELLQAQARYGEDSAQAKNAELDQELRNRLSAIDAQVVSGELDDAAAATLKLQVELAAELTAQIEAATAAEERRVAAIQVSYAYQTQIANQQQQRQAGVDAITEAMAKETSRLNNQISLNQQIAQFGKDSVEVAEERASQAREAYAQSLMDQKILGNNLRTQMDAYDLSVQAAKEAKAMAAALEEAAEAQAGLTDLGESYETQLAVVNAEITALEQGKNAEVAAFLEGERIKATALYNTSTAVAQQTGNIIAMAEASLAYLDAMSALDALSEARGKLATLKKPKKARGGGGGGGASKKSPAEEFAKYLDGLKQQAELEKELVGLFGAKRAEEEAVIKARQKYGEAFGKSQEAELRGTLRQIEADKERQRVLEEARQQQEGLANSMASSFGDAFTSVVDGTKSMKDAFRDMAKDIIKQLFEVLVVKRLVGSAEEGKEAGLAGFLVKGIATIFQADGGAWQGGSQIKAYANGGVVGGPTYFPMAGGKTGLMGEAGPEAIMPLKRGANGKLGVQTDGGSQGNVVVNQSFNFSANGDDSVKKLIAQAAPQIANMTKQSMMNDRRRGGQMKATFG